MHDRRQGIFYYDNMENTKATPSPSPTTIAISSSIGRPITTSISKGFTIDGPVVKSSLAENENSEIGETDEQSE